MSIKKIITGGLLSMLLASGVASAADFDDFIEWAYVNLIENIYLAALAFLFLYGFLTWFYVFLVRVPYLYLNGKRTASKAVIKGEEQQYYDYWSPSHKPYWLDTLFQLTSLKADKSADEFTWGGYVMRWLGWLLGIAIFLYVAN